MTARELIKGSLRLLGVLASGENPTAEEAQDALGSLNSLLDTWRTERLMVYAIAPETFALQAGKLSYTMGPGGDFDTVRPVGVEKVQMIYTQGGGPDPLNLPIEIINLDQYNQFVVPTTQSPIPMWVYVTDEFPLRRLLFYTVPSTVNQVQIYVWKQLAPLTTLDAELALPPGYERALRYGLAVELAPEFGAAPPDAVVANAMDAKARLKSVNNNYAPLLQADAALIPDSCGFNYLTGE